MISSLPTFSWTSIRIRRGWRLFALAGVALLGAALLTEPWLTLLAISVVYLALLPFSIASYARVKRRRATPAGRAAAAARGQRWLTRTATGADRRGVAAATRPCKRGDDLARRSRSSIAGDARPAATRWRGRRGWRAAASHGIVPSFERRTRHGLDFVPVQRFMRACR